MSTVSLQTSTAFYSDFILPWISSAGFGLYPSDLQHFHTVLLAEAASSRFPFGYFFKEITLATQINSLASYSKLTM